MNVTKTVGWGLCVLLGAVRLSATNEDLASRVVILANSREPESVDLARFYAEKRGVPVANIVALPLPAAESITWREFVDEVYQPLQDELYRRGWIEGTVSSLLDRMGRRRYAPDGHHISYLVVCRGVPLRIYNDPALIEEDVAKKYPQQFRRNDASVDSELSLLAQPDTQTVGFLPNPLFGNEHPSALDSETVVKVSRLDGPTAERARRLVTSALEGERRGLLGRFYVDLVGPHPDGDRWLESVRAQLVALGFDGDVERTGATFDRAARFDAPVLYFGWYAGDLNGPFAVPGFTFPPGAVALHIHSFSAQTLRSDTQGWCGPLVARGVTATVGNVFEPYLQLTHRPDLLLRALSRGWNFGDAACFALPVLSWQTVAIGDPLYRPFKVTLEEQEHEARQLPPALAPYATIRRANLLVREDHLVDAQAFLQAGMNRAPSLPVALSLAKVALAQNDSAAAVVALSLVASFKSISPAEWPLLREAAALLAQHGARPAALQVYGKLARVEAPTADAFKAMLVEARAVAEASGDSKRSAEFARQLDELEPAPLAK